MACGSAMATDDFDAEILALRVSGESNQPQNDLAVAKTGGDRFRPRNRRRRALSRESRLSP
jgi:hypothetical protein